jgi:CelD/BcsL family acetyltransferase involved in cellulose biosynthesis
LPALSLHALSMTGPTLYEEAPAAQKASPPVAEGRHGGVEIIEQLSEEWRALCEDSPDDEPFYRPEWLEAYVRAFVPPGRFLLIAARTSGKLTAVLPLVEERAWFSGLPVRKLRGATVLSNWRFDLVRRSGPEGDEAAAAVWKFLRDYRGWDVLELPDVAEGGAAEGLARLARADGFAVDSLECMQSPYVPLDRWDGTNDFWLRQADPSLRSNLPRRRKKLAAQGPLELKRYETADPALLQCFYDLESSGWKGRQKTAIQCDPKVRAFYDDLARVAQRFGYLALYFLEHNGTPIAGTFGLTYRGRHFSLKGGTNASYNAFGPGHLLHDLLLRDCAERGLIEFDLLGHREDWKRRWTTQFRRHSYWFVFQKGVFGKLARFAKFQVNPLAKRILRRRAPNLD